MHGPGTLVIVTSLDPRDFSGQIGTMVQASYVSRRPRSVAAEQSILNAALKILSEGGYAALTIDRVAATARASKTTIYRRWKTKEHLILAVFNQLPMAEPVAGPSLEADLIELFKQFSQIMEDSPLRGVLPKLVADCVNDPRLSLPLIQINERRRAPIRQVLNHAVRRGELPHDADIELAIDVIQGAISIRLYFLLDRLSEDWIRGLVQLLLRGLGVAPARTLAAKSPGRRSRNR
jgi:AcrR family transcriptional regulator